MLAFIPVLAIALGFIAPAAAKPLAEPILAATTTASSAKPNPTQVYINSIAYGGTGCPQGSVGSFISVDQTTFTLIFDDYVASIGPGVPITSTRLNCQINLNLQYPSGFQYSILNTDFRGYAGLDKGVTGVQQATYYFSGSAAQVSVSSTFVGPTSANYEVTDAIPFTSTVWSPCGAALPLNINSQVRLTSTVATATGLLTDDSIDGNCLDPKRSSGFLFGLDGHVGIETVVSYISREELTSSFFIIEEYNQLNRICFTVATEVLPTGTYNSLWVFSGKHVSRGSSEVWGIVCLQ